MTGESTARGTPLVVATLVAAVAAIAGATAGLDWLHWLAKPAATLACVVLAARRDGDAGYRRAIVAGLLASTAGDVWLMLPGDRFVAGLASFLVAHLCYIAAFARGTRPAFAPLPSLPYAIVAGALVAVLRPSLGALLVPVACYALVLAAMAAIALTRALQRRTPPAWWAALGGVLFMLSDTLLALDRFVAPLPARSLFVLASYWAAQLLIALSVAPDRRAPASAGTRRAS